MRKKGFIACIVLTVLNLFATIFCLILNMDIVTEGPGTIGLIVIAPFSLILFPAIAILAILSIVFAIRGLKSESGKIRVVSIVLLIINIIYVIALVVMMARLLPLFGDPN